MSRISNVFQRAGWLSRLTRKAAAAQSRAQVTCTCDGAEPDTFLLREFAERSLIPLR
jgi:hypothetical protein